MHISITLRALPPILTVKFNKRKKNGIEEDSQEYYKIPFDENYTNKSIIVSTTIEPNASTTIEPNASKTIEQITSNKLNKS